MHPIATITPAPPVAPLEDTVTLRMPRKSAEVLRAVLNFIGGPNATDTPRTRMDQVHFALVQAGVKSANHDLIVAPSLQLGRRTPVGMRLAWVGGLPLIPSAAETGGPVVGWPSDKQEISNLANTLERAQALPKVLSVFPLPQTIGAAVAGRVPPPGVAFGNASYESKPIETARAEKAKAETVAAEAARVRAVCTEVDAKEKTRLNAILTLALLAEFDGIMFPSLR